MFDVNTLVSAFLIGSKTNSAAFKHALTVGDVIISPEITVELNEVFTRKKFDRYQSFDFRLATLALLEEQLLGLPSPVVSIEVCRDPKDNKYLELAVAAGASAIITGDKDLLVLHPFRGIPIVSAADFMALSI